RTPETDRGPGAGASRAFGSRRSLGLGTDGDERDATADAGDPPGLGTTTAGRGLDRHVFVDARAARQCQASRRGRRMRRTQLATPGPRSILVPPRLKLTITRGRAGPAPNPGDPTLRHAALHR